MDLLEVKLRNIGVPPKAGLQKFFFLKLAHKLSLQQLVNYPLSAHTRFHWWFLLLVTSDCLYLSVSPVWGSGLPCNLSPLMDLKKNG